MLIQQLLQKCTFTALVFVNKSPWSDFNDAHVLALWPYCLYPPSKLYPLFKKKKRFWCIFNITVVFYFFLISTIINFSFCFHFSLRSCQSLTDQLQTGIVWSPVNLSPEHMGPGLSLKVTVVINFLRDPLTFTCDCEFISDFVYFLPCKVNYTQLKKQIFYLSSIHWSTLQKSVELDQSVIVPPACLNTNGHVNFSEVFLIIQVRLQTI